ncbi:XRE family transcriptional regulator [Palleronia sp. LCG004]|uniref:helix-turn-helix domain-containing protein n=1 Tax=Palleronia sp. LCG004 TaxID=3079304 RepID=UPI0029422A7E|nr:XRE family transcriptional regulator [Palleronia sp. LCG004]WOI57560.1 XRE family transcriptional regulator [Palleronia sp. LCG004]
MMENPDAILSLLPERLRRARQSRGLSLDAVARLSGVSRSMVSQIERGASSPTVSTLWNLTRALGVDFAGLLEESRASAIEVLRAEDVPTIANRGTGCTIRILSPPEDAGRHEVYELRFEEGGALSSTAHARGTQENVTVIEGALTVTSGAAAHPLRAGETARYAADVPHRLEACGAARAFLVVKGG